jgi:crossover junction endodeoxyribonuclease RuvC
MIILGIDPGIKGGWATITDGDLDAWGRMPTLRVRSKIIVDAKELSEALYPGGDYGVIEVVGAFPHQGRSSCFSFGHATGSATAVAMVACDKMEWVAPSVWKKHFGLGSDKRASLDLAKMKFGSAGPDWSVLANDGVAEAALMARWFLDKRIIL